MKPESVNPFDSPAVDSLDRKFQLQAGLSAVRGRLIASGICLGLGLGIGYFWVTRLRAFKVSTDGSAALVAVFLLILSVVFLIFAVVSRRRGDISIDAKRIGGVCMLSGKGAYRELFWSDLNGWEVRNKKQLVLQDENGNSYEFYIGWYQADDRQQIVKLCRDRLGAPAVQRDLLSRDGE